MSPEDELQEAACQQAFDDEHDYWDSLLFWGPTEQAQLLDESALDVDYSAGYASDSSEDF